MADVWEMEVQRARTWLKSEARTAAEHRRAVLLRVNAHMAFVDHQRALRCRQEEDGDDLAGLDFLDDVNAEDMTALLQAEAVTTGAGQATTVAAVSTVTAVDAALKPIEMPSHLIASPPRPTLRGNGFAGVKARTAVLGAMVKTPTPTVAPTSIGMALSSDENVKELMQDLQLDIHVHSDVEEERKTEESTPPHVANGFQDVSISAVKDKTKRAGVATLAQPNGSRVEEDGLRPKPLHDSNSSSSNDPASKKPVNPVDPEAVASEMLSWVSGERDPTVLQRKESLAKRNRKRTRHFGVGSEEEQRYVQQKVKYYTQDSDSDDESSGDDNDYSPSEDPVDFEPEEPVDNEEMLSDDYLNSDDASRSKKRKRLKRLKKASPAKRKTKKLVSASSAKDLTSGTGQSSSAEARHSDVDSDHRAGKVDPPVSTVTAPKKNHLDGATATTIDLCQIDSDTNLAEGTRIFSTDRGTGHGVPVNGKSPVLQRRKVSKSSHALERDTTTTKFSVLEKKQASSASLPLAGASDGADDGYETPELVSDGDESDKENTAANASSFASASATAIDLTAAEHTGEDGEVSDTGTVDFDFDRDDTPYAQLPSGSTERPAAGTAKLDTSGDVSDADTVVLDEDPESDDLGLDYSDDSDHDADHESEQPASVPGVQQFFDYKPLKLKPKKAIETRKMIPVHPEADFVKAMKAPKDPTPAVYPGTQSTTSTGSNGLRPKKPQPLEMSVTMKGKHPVARRSIKVLGQGQTPRRASNSAATRQAHATATHKDTDPSTLKQRYAQPDRPTGSNGLRKATKSVPRSEEAGSQDEGAGESSARYLSYSGSNGSGSSGTAKSAPARPTPVVAPSRFGGGAGDFSAGTSVGALRPTANGTKMHQFRRDPQMSLYDALHIDGKEESSAFMDRDNGYKRPSAFKKLQAESARSGVSLVSSKTKEPDWDRIPIPKKGIAFTSGVPEPPPKAADSVSRSSKKTGKASPPKKASRYGDSVSQPSRDKFSKGGRGKAHKGGGGTQRPSYYGPSNNSATTRDDRRRSRTPSPPRYNYKRHEENEIRGGRGDKKRRVSSRSSSPRGRERDWDRERDWSSREKKSSKQRDRSPSPRNRSADRGGYRHEKNSKKRSVSPPRHDKNRPSSSSSSSYRGADARDDSMTKRHKSAGSSRDDGGDPRCGRSTSPETGALATFDSGNDLYISESDNEIEMDVEKREDIRFDLEGIAVDPALIARRVYVTGFNPAICGEELEEIFAQFGVEVCLLLGIRPCILTADSAEVWAIEQIDRETGFPSIDVFTCQRTLKARGDASVTFVDEDGAAAAVEELNGIAHTRSSASPICGVYLTHLPGSFSETCQEFADWRTAHGCAHSAHPERAVRGRSRHVEVSGSSLPRRRQHVGQCMSAVPSQALLRSEPPQDHARLVALLHVSVRSTSRASLRAISDVMFLLNVPQMLHGERQVRQRLQGLRRVASGHWAVCFVSQLRR